MLLKKARAALSRLSLSAGSAQEDDSTRSTLVLGARIGTGGTAAVFKGCYRGRRVAVKVALDEDPHAAAAATANEANALAALAGSEWVVQLLAVTQVALPGSQRSRPALVLEHMEGGCLATLVYRHMICPRARVVAFPHALQWALDVARGLADMHALRPAMLHNDVKSSNLLLTHDKARRRMVAKLADFGLALRPAVWVWCPVTREAWAGSDASGRALPQRSAAGTWFYMAPEVTTLQRYSTASDVFALGVTLSELFGGALHMYVEAARLPHVPMEEVGHAYARRVAAGYRPDLARSLPECVQQLIRECWHQQPSLRPSAHEVVQRLAAISAANLAAVRGAKAAF